MSDKLKIIGEYITPIITIVGATSAFWYFILYENIEIEYNTRIETLKVKNDALKDDRERLEKENLVLMRWLEESPQSFISLKNKIQKQDSLIKSLMNENNKTEIIEIKKYKFTDKLKEGETFIDNKTNSMLSIFKINSNYSVEGKINIPGTSSNFKNIKPGDKWEFLSNSKRYKIVLEKVDPLFEEFTVSVLEY